MDLEFLIRNKATGFLMRDWWLVVLCILQLQREWHETKAYGIAEWRLFIKDDKEASLHNRMLNSQKR